MTSKIPPSEVPPHRTTRSELRVRFVETDLMGIVHHGTYLSYFEAGRVDYLHKRGVSYEAWTKEGIHLPVVEANLRYRKAARFDDRLVVASTCAELTRVTVRFTYRIFRGEDVLCDGFTLLACVGDDLTPKRIPGFISDAFTGPEKPESEWT